MSELEESWSMFRESSQVVNAQKSTLSSSQKASSRPSIAHLSDTYQPPHKVDYTRPNAISYEQQRYEREAEELKQLAEQPKMSNGTFERLASFLTLRVKQSWDYAEESTGSNKLLEILANMNYLSRNDPKDLQLVETKIYPAILEMGQFCQETVRLLVFGIEFGAIGVKFAKELDELFNGNSDKIVSLTRPFAHLRFNKMSRERTPFEQKIGANERLRRQGNPAEDDFCSFQPALNTRKMAISEAEIEREKAYLYNRIPIHNQIVAEFVEALINQGKEQQAAQYAKVNLIPMLQGYETQEERARYQHWLGVLKAEEIRELRGANDVSELRDIPDIRKSMISFHLAKELPGNRISSTKTQKLRDERIQRNIQLSNEAKIQENKAETLENTPIMSSKRPIVASQNEKTEINLLENAAISDHIYRQKIAEEQKAEEELAKQMLGRTLAGRSELEMTEAAARITQRMTSRQAEKEDRKVLVNLEIAVRPGKTGKLVMREGDSIKTVIGFCKTYELKESQLIKLKKELENFFDINKIPYDTVSDEEAIEMFRGKAKQNFSSITISKGPDIEMAASALDSQPTQEALTHFMSDDLWEELGLVE